MWLWWIPLLILYFTGSFALIKLPEPNGVLFDSVNFNNTLRWTQNGRQPDEIVYDVQYRIYGEKIWRNKPECHHSTAHSCDLTNEIVQENDWYYARVMAVLKNTNSTWALSERFCPLEKTIIGAPAVEYTAGIRSITILVNLPRVPPKEGVQRSIEDIFAVIEYEVHLNQSLNEMVFYASNKSGYFKIELLEPNTKYCATVQLSLRKGIISKKSQLAHFCIQTLQEGTLTIILLAFVFSGAIITGIFCYVAYSYISQRKTLPQSLNLDQILSRKHALLKQSPPTLQLVISYMKKKDAFQFEQVIHMEDVDFLKLASNETEQNMKPKEFTVASQLGTYAPQCHTRILQTSLPSANDCEIQSNSPSRPVDNECFSPYCAQATDGLSNSRCSSQNSSRAQTQNYGTILHMTSRNSTKLNTDPRLDRLSSTQKVPLNALQTVSEDLLYDNRDLMLQNVLGLVIQNLEVKEEKPIHLPPFLTLLDDKQQMHQTNWKENQPIEMPLLLSLKDENQIQLSLFQYGQQVESQSFLSLLNDKDISCLQSERMNDQPTEEESLTEVLQTDLKDGQLVKASPFCPLLKSGEFTGLLHVKAKWKDENERHLLTFHSSMREGQTLPSNTTMEGGKLLDDWEIQVHMDE
ncbi:interleukin-22 receptor subunit alpha-1-like [Heptranchias perlo]|uniref:interleukin-22 receptor subunit alpha-1-like n=1 Tax=Heptranchias perlo TaxID=212740 RepID=UPI00355A5BEC